MSLLIHVFGRKLSQEEFQQLLTDYHLRAYAIAEKFYAPRLGDDEKENIAFKALQRALERFDPDRNVKFSTYLYMLIMNDLRDAAVSAKRRPLSIRDVPNNDRDERKDIFEFISDYRDLQQSDQEAYNQLVDELGNRLTERQQAILDMMMAPQIYVDKYNETYKPDRPAKKMNYDIIGELLGISIATVTYEMNKVRQITNDVLQELERNANLKKSE